MDEIVGLLAEAVSKRVRAARAEAVRREFQARGDALSAAVPVGIAGRRSGSPGAPAGRSAPAAPAEGLARPAATDDPRPPRPVVAVPVSAPAPLAIASPLLAAFGSAGGLLGAIVLSEALAPPLALRDNPFRPGGVEGL